MNKQNEIPKKLPFEVPEGYFDTLPGIIQSRVAKQPQEGTPYFRFALQYAIPVVIVAAAALFFLMPEKHQSTESLLASVSTEELVAYLEESDMTTEDLVNGYTFDEATLDALEAEVYFNFELDENLTLDNL